LALCGYEARLLGLTQPETEAHRLHHLMQLTRDVKGHLVRKCMDGSLSVQLQKITALLADPDSDSGSDISLFTQLGIIMSFTSVRVVFLAILLFLITDEFLSDLLGTCIKIMSLGAT
jgi:hypothetical protein